MTKQEVPAARITEILAALNADPSLDLTSPASAGHDAGDAANTIPEYDAANVAALCAYGMPGFALVDGTVILHGGVGWRAVAPIKRVAR